MRALPDYQLVPPPEGGFWRVTRWHHPFSPSDPPPAIGSVGAEQDDAGRWDAPDESFRTLYCASEPEGAIGEKLGDFALNPAAVMRIEAFLEEEPDPEFEGDTLAAGLSRDDIDGFEWTLAHAPADLGARLIDVWHPRTLAVSLGPLAPLLLEYGLKALDRRALLDERRDFTRQLAGHFHAGAEDSGARGLRYDSRLPPGWECWALWEPLPLDPADVSEERVTIDTPALRTAAAQLGVVLFDA